MSLLSVIAKRGNLPEGKTDESYAGVIPLPWGISPLRSGFAITPVGMTLSSDVIQAIPLGGHERERTEPKQANVRSCNDGSCAGVRPLATVCGGASLKAGEP